MGAGTLAPKHLISACKISNGTTPRFPTRLVMQVMQVQAYYGSNLLIKDFRLFKLP
jgi:hypothetical protein